MTDSALHSGTGSKVTPPGRARSKASRVALNLMTETIAELRSELGVEVREGRTMVVLAIARASPGSTIEQAVGRFLKGRVTCSLPSAFELVASDGKLLAATYCSRGRALSNPYVGQPFLLSVPANCLSPLGTRTWLSQRAVRHYNPSSASTMK